MQTAPNPQAQPQLIFDATLTPHRSLGPRGFLLLMLAVGGVGFLTGLAFFLIGAWPVAGFMGLEFLLVYVAFRVNYHRARIFEQLELSHDGLVVRQVDQRGGERQWRFQPYWLRIEMANPPDHDSQLVLRSHGRRVVIGAFLTPQERLSLAQALERALQRLRCSPCAPASL